MVGLHGLGRLESAAAASYVEPEDRLPSARGRKGLSTEVVEEGDLFQVPELDEWKKALESDDRDGDID